MLQQQSRSTAFEKKINQRWAQLAAELEQDATLHTLMQHLRYLLASTAESCDGFSTHPICKNPLIQAYFIAFKKQILTKIGPCPPWQEEPVFLENEVLRLLGYESKRRLPRLHAIFEDNLPTFLRHVAFTGLELSASTTRDRERFHKLSCENMPIAWDRLPDNPIRFERDPITGAISAKDLHLASGKQLMEIESLGRIYEPEKQAGRPKGSEKPAGSGKKSSVDEQVFKDAWEAKQQPKKNKSIPWWLKLAHKKQMPVPEDPKKRDAFRKKLEEWAIKGKTLARKKSEV